IQGSGGIQADPSSCTIVVFFFFQAEDGIRDRTVTGVQTCALPISRNLVEFLVTSSKLVRRTENYRSFDTHHCGPGPRRAPLEREYRALGRCDSQTTWLNRMRANHLKLIALVQ